MRLIEFQQLKNGDKIYAYGISYRIIDKTDCTVTVKRKNEQEVFYITEITTK